MKRDVLLLILVAVFWGGIKAQQLTIADCRTMALKHNKSRQQAALQVRQTELMLRSTRALFFPDFSLQSGVLYDTGQGSSVIDFQSMIAPMLSHLAPLIQNIGKQGKPVPQLSALSLPRYELKYRIGWLFSGNVVLRQPIYMGGKIRAAYRMSQTGVMLAQQNERLTQSEVLLQVDEAYAQVVKAEELEAVAQRYVELLAQLDSSVQSAVRHGLRMDNDRLKVRVRANEVELQLLRARNGVVLAKMNLCRLIGRPLSTSLKLSHDYPLVADVAALRGCDISQRPEMVILQGQEALADEQVRIARSALLPQVTLMAKYGYTHGLEFNDQTLLNGWNFAAGVHVSVPLYHFGDRSNKLKIARLKAEQAELECQEKAELMRLELARANNNVDEAAVEVALADTALLQAERNMELIRKHYEAGLETVSNYLESQAQWQQAYERRIDARFRHYLSGVAFLKAAGVLVP